jgi:hypothetical protein
VVTNLTSLLDLYVSGAPEGAGGDNGIDHDKNWLRFTYVFIFCRSHDLPSPPYLLVDAASRGVSQY